MSVIYVGRTQNMTIQWSDLLTRLNDPEWVRHRLQHRVSGTVSGLIHGFDGVNVPSMEWDNLIILDACRADTFESVCDLDVFTEYRRVKSKGSSTEEWVVKNWKDGTFPDTTYVTANPVVARYTPSHFYNRVDAFEDHFDEQLGTVLPNVMRDRAYDAFEHNKRMVVHFMQPHYPFYNSDLGISFDPWHPGHSGGSNAVRNPWVAIKTGDVSVEAVAEAYRETLEDVLPIAIELATDLPGTSVVTSDHGNTYGRWAPPLPIRIYGHPTGFRYPELAHVPWGLIEGEDREIVSEQIVENVADSDTVQDRLQAFGYVED